jgi:hypothetical protein
MKAVRERSAETLTMIKWACAACAPESLVWTVHGKKAAGARPLHPFLAPPSI